MKSLDYYAGATREAIENDVVRDSLYARIHEAATSTFENPPELQALPWIKDRKFVTTAPADALNAAIRTFASRLPNIEIQPLSEAPEEHDRTEQMESLMKWEFQRMNRVGKKSPHWRVVEYAMKYCAVAIETSYLPYVYADRKDDRRIKEVLRTKNFRWNVHDPSNVHVREGDDILECVVNTDVLTAQALIDRYGMENRGIREMIGGIDLKDPKALNQTFYSVYDYSDWDVRCIWIADNGGARYINRSSPAGIEILREERTISFLPWVYVDLDEPLLRQMVEAGLWENVNVLRTMQFSKTVDMAAHPEYWIQTPDGTLRGVSIDQGNPNQPIVTGPGTNINKLQPPMLDPQLSNMVTIAEQEVFRTTVAQILASVERYAGSQNFSVVNAMLSAAIAQLALAQMCAERAETAALLQHFAWIEETDIPMVGFRAYTKGENKPKGQEISIKKGDFDLNYLYLSVELKPATVMDEQTEINNAINKVERLGMSRKMAWDELGLDNYELSEAQKTEEDLYLALIQGKQREAVGMADIKVQIAGQQMMQQAQQGQQPQPGPEGAAGQSQFAAQQGMDVRGGGATTTMPGQGREQLTGQAASGQEIV